MRLATRRDGSRDGQLMVVSASGTTAADAPPPWRTLQHALDEWSQAEPALRRVAEQLVLGTRVGGPITYSELMAPLPRAHEWLDGSSYLNHVILARKARGASPPATLHTEPLMYQGGGSDFLGPRDPFVLRDESWGLDLEAEVCVVTADVPAGTPPNAAAKFVRLITLANDWTLRELVPAELTKGFGFVQSKPATGFAPFAVTPDELGSDWRDGRAHIRVGCRLNGVSLGDLEAGPDMHFSFADLIAHAARTRRLGAGTIIGSGTVSSRDTRQGVACLAERRAQEIIATGSPVTAFLKAGDYVEIEGVGGPQKTSLFGLLSQHVVGAG